ncbi:hypothetical protein H483_0105695 [Dietzia sp. UCD-THP]|uniref:DUF3499 domain-containing protein n=1 Tax=Dietzia natronolimnaea TaxID=161920 RepID=A0A2A2WRL3_9ACTN|nr:MULTISPECIES: DUF3499 domain-containing protein [Dietzia]EYT64131.1 hypothetical protein H483_0105695 [Dietzia sp. UCD-THP]PAY23614.1 DUF3499 domain-containing protein [Dietzia natronolimnaea]
MSENRRCCRPGCPNRAVATLTYVYADSTAVVGPLPAISEPHSWDLCAAHALRITAPRGWDLVRHPDIDVSAEDSDLTALLDAVAGGPVGGRRAGAALVDADRLRRLGVSDPAPVLAEESVEPSGSRPHLRVVPNATDRVDTSSAEPADGDREPGPELG